MITKQSLSGNISLGNVSSLVNGCDSSSGDSSHEEISRDDQGSNDRRTNDCTLHRGSSHTKSIPPGLLASDDSCNAVDKKLGSDDEQQRRRANLFRDSDLSFNGKICPLIEGTGRVTNCALEVSTISGSYGFVQIKPKASGSYECDEAAQEKTLNETCELLTKENKSLTHYENEQSPDMFAEDDDTVDDKKKNDESLSRAYQRTSGMSSRELECVDESKVDRIERTLLKRLQMSLAGIPPPPALTYSAIDVGSMLAIYHSNAERWLAAHSLSKSDSAREATDNTNETDGSATAGMDDKKAQECLSKPTQTLADLANIAWPELTKHRAHGLHYNRSLATEMFELLSLKYIERYLSAETSSSFNMTILQSSAKKRNQRLKLLSQSPGRRLSHLAKRRAIFSSESLLSNSDSKCATSSSGRGIINANSLRKLNPHRVCNTRQVFLDPKKSDNRRKNKIKTPKRRTPGGKKSPHRRTPGSSSKSLTLRHVVTSSKPGTQPVHVPATRETSKRALFLSPQNGGVTASARAYGSNSKQTDRSIFSEARVLKSKRSLFSPTHESQSSIQPCSGASTFAGTAASSSLKTMSVSNAVSSNKRGRSPAVDNDNDERTEKIPRMESSGLSEEDLTPRSLKFARSKSFCVGLQSAGGQQTGPSECATGLGGKLLFRSNSEVSAEDGHRPVMMLTENHKKKLLWAVSHALNSKQITTKHEQFKEYASNLVRVVKRLFLEFNDLTTNRTSDKLLNLANKHVYEVIQGKSVDDIYFREKIRIMHTRNMPKLQGYIAPEEYERRKLKRTGSIVSISSDVSSPFDFSLSASQSLLSQSSVLSQGSSLGGLSQLSQTSSSFVRGGQIKTAASTGSMNTVGLVRGVGTSLSTTVLRENVDSELRQRSTKKLLSFSGKDQKNVSPFRMEKNSLLGGSANANKLLVGGALNSSIMKAKRQISFE